MDYSFDTGCEKWLTINEVPTSVQIWGGWTTKEMTTDTVIVVVTGNPGIPDFYVRFMKSLQVKCGGHPVWVIGQAGHTFHKRCPSISDRPELFDLNGQVKHKREFISTYVPEDKRIILIGHSIGAKVCIELMKDKALNHRVRQVHLMYPCLENIGTTRNGHWFQKMGVRVFPFLALLAKWLLWVPIRVKFFILKIAAMVRFLTTEMDECILHGVIKLFTPGVIEQAIFLGNDEMMKVKELDHEVYHTMSDKIFAYYGQHDGWSPLTHYENLRKRHPDVRAVVLNKKFEHAFMVRHSDEMAEEIALNVLPPEKNLTLNS